MLNRIKLTNFQRHRSLEVTFNGGLTALRGANEAGKSTLLRAICYALFGVKALPDGLDATVTWGEETRTLKVELELAVDGVVYAVKRGKSGAEVNYDGGIVTGQNEVTNFCCRLLKCDAGAASRLVLSNQNEIRGALEAGAKATTDLIERLAEFDQIDQLIELMEDKLSLGATAGVEQAIAAAQSELDAARAAAVEPDLPMLDHRIEDAQELLERAEGVAAGAQAAVDTVTQALNDGKVAAAARAALDREISQCETRIAEVEKELAEQRAVQAPDNDKVADLRARLAAAQDDARLRAAYGKVLPFVDAAQVRGDLPARTLVEGSLAELDERIEFVSGRANRDDLAASSKRLVALSKRQLITAGSCTLCGKDVSAVPEVVERNAALELQVAALDAEAADLQLGVAADRLALGDLKQIRAASEAPLRVLDVVGDLAERVDNQLPPVLRWKGPEIAATPEDAQQLQTEIDGIERQQRAFERAGAKIETLGQERARLYVAREDAFDRRARGPRAVDIDQLQQAVYDARDALRPAREAAERAKSALEAAERAKSDAVAAYQRAQQELKRAKGALAARREELQELQFNNALLKRVRACRPMIADKLWNLVLSAVSTYFSDMRGARSRVAKSGDGFTVDGHPITTLSGSTLDILGLAIRVALVRTFMPAAPFLILDEPAAACDDERTNNMLGFLAGAGFKQVLLVTHEDISQAVADNMITL